MQNHVIVKPYIMDEKMILYVVDDGAQAPEVIKFVTGQDELDYVEVDQVKHYGPKSSSKSGGGKAKKAKKSTGSKKGGKTKGPGAGGKGGKGGRKKAAKKAASGKKDEL